jgi:argonaute-like protein implicated in RNA metabolism and viral defense
MEQVQKQVQEELERVQEEVQKQIQEELEQIQKQVQVKEEVQEKEQVQEQVQEKEQVQVKEEVQEKEQVQDTQISTNEHRSPCCLLQQKYWKRAMLGVVSAVVGIGAVVWWRRK